jgi:hypothetical protein
MVKSATTDLRKRSTEGCGTDSQRTRTAAHAMIDLNQEVYRYVTGYEGEERGVTLWEKSCKHLLDNKRASLGEIEKTSVPNNLRLFLLGLLV